MEADEMKTDSAERNTGRSPADVALSIVVPVFNEKENIPRLVTEIRKALDGILTCEILYVDDGSQDGTAELLAELAGHVPELRVVRHQGNFGQSAAICTGVARARGALIATLDGDGQNDPADIPRLVACLESQPEEEALRTLIVGRRHKRKDTWLKRISSRIANRVRAGLLKDQTPDTGSGLKVFSRQVFLDLPRFDHMHRFLPALVIRNGGKVISVDVRHRRRTRGTSKYGLHNRLWVGIVDLLGVMWLQRRPLRLQVFSNVNPEVNDRSE
jgi:dolichol-phosphate mannosyltransferase